MHALKEIDDTSLEGLPTWKRDLILRKRANLNNHVSSDSSHPVKTTSYKTPTTAVSPKTNPSQQLCSQRGHQLASTCSTNGPTQSSRSVQGQNLLRLGVVRNDSSDANRNSDSSNSARRLNNGSVTSSADESHTSKMHHKGMVNSRRIGGFQMAGTDDEEFQYGPGIVSRLKDRYLSLAMRESKSRSTLRKFSSLEDLLDEDAPWPKRGRNQSKTRVPAGLSPIKRDIMKRTRSVDSLSYRRQESQEKQLPKSRSSGLIKQPKMHLEKDVIIIEMAKSNGQENCFMDTHDPLKKAPSLLGEDELPQPDTVRQTKQLFENNGSKSVRGTAAAKVAAYKAAQSAKKQTKSIGVKPAIKAKPAILCNSNKMGPAETDRSNRPAGKPVLKSVRPTPVPTSPPVLNYAKKPPGLTPVTASVTAPLVNGDAKKDHKALTKSIPVQKPQQDVPDRVPTKPRSVSPVPANLPPSPPSSHKVSIPNAFNKDAEHAKENQRVLHENRKNSEKSTPFREVQSNSKASPAVQKQDEKPIVNKVPIAESTHKKVEASLTKGTPKMDETPVLPPKLSPKSRAPEPSNTSVMFNFTKRAETPSYIENDGMDMSKRKQIKPTSGYVIMPGYEGPADSSTDDVDEAELSFVDMSPPVCNVSFIGDGVIINGRSNLQRQPRNKKLEISFDLVSTTIHQYPSENSLMEDDDDEFYDPSRSSTGGLASYTPSKLQCSDPFELGVSKSTNPHTPPKEKIPPQEDDHLRPADDTQTVAWSSESAPDLLF